MKKLFLPIILLPLLTSCYERTYSGVKVEGSTQEKTTLYTTAGTFRTKDPQYFVTGKECSFQAIGEFILEETLECE